MRGSTGSGDDVLTGGGGNNILIGGDGNDILIGGRRRNLLIGGMGSDLLVAGSHDDILIAGTTDHDGNAAALCALMKEWGRTDLSYKDRVGHIINGGGLNGSVVLNGKTVHTDHTTNVLIGGAGADLFFMSHDDVLLGWQKGETVIQI